MCSQDGSQPNPLPLDEAARRIKNEGSLLGRQLAHLWDDLGELFKAELALSRSALLRIGLYLLLILVLAGSAWLGLLVTLVLGLHALGYSAWSAALLVSLLLLGAALILALLVKRLLPDLGFRHSKGVLRQILACTDLQDAPPNGENDNDEPS